MAFCVTNKDSLVLWLSQSIAGMLSIRVTHMDSVASDFTFPEKRVLNVCFVLEWLCVSC